MSEPERSWEDSTRMAASESKAEHPPDIQSALDTSLEAMMNQLTVEEHHAVHVAAVESLRWAIDRLRAQQKLAGLMQRELRELRICINQRNEEAERRIKQLTTRCEIQGSLIDALRESIKDLEAECRRHRPPTGPFP